MRGNFKYVPDAGMKNNVALTWQQALLAAFVIIVCALIFWNERSQSSSWIYPYFSGAVNLGGDLVWRVDIKGFADFANMAYSQQMDYRFVRTDASNLAVYSVLDKGYVFIVWAAQNLLFWLPQIKAVIWFQILFHIVSSLWVVNQLGSRRQQAVFMLTYGVNPVVLHFVTFAYYYYWQIIPALAWLVYEVKGKSRSAGWLFLLAFVLSAAFLIRQSTIIVSLFILGYFAWQYRKAAGWVALACFLSFALYAKNPSQPWHTAYVGIGAYPNDAGIELSDESGYKLLKERTGIQINTAPPGGNYYDEKIREQYYGVLKESVTSYAKEHPLQLAKNAVLNGLQGFSIGYPVGHLTFAYVSAILGMAMLLLLIWQGMYLVIILIGCSMIGFVVYYPPIPAYMFGNYLLLSIALVSLVDRLGRPAILDSFYRKG